MYAAILTSIETKEYSWESNFDHFETILYRCTVMDNKSGPPEPTREQEQGRKRFCRDFNKPEGCPKTAPTLLGSDQEPQQSRGQSSTFVQPALSGTNNRGSTLKVTLTVPTKCDHQTCILISRSKKGGTVGKSAKCLS